MNKKFFVPFETAKALKANGYDEECEYFYDEKGMQCYYRTTISNSDLFTKQYAAPTYYEVIDWLENCKNVFISLESFRGKKIRCNR